jgi:type VI secretion system secreted protein Hcp
MFDVFLKIATIPGESTDEKHKDWIEVLSYGLEVTQPKTATGSSAGAQFTQRADFGDFNFSHALDAASPKLFLACANGEHIADATLELCRATGDKQVYMQYKMTDVVITSIKPGGDSKGDDMLPIEEVSMNYSKLECVYTKTDTKTGKPAGDIKTFWDRAINKGG